MAAKYDLLIVWNDGERKIIKDVEEYKLSLDAGAKVFYFYKNGYRGFVPVDKVRYFGRQFDYDGCMVRE